MTTLNLTANGKPQELILAYLQENASDVLAEKINNGTPFTKDGKQLVNKKTLDSFMTFASEEAKKLAEKNARSACVEDSVVCGWAIHYFEEDTIEGKLFNEDGTEYKPVVKTKPKTVTKPVIVEPPKPKQQQASLWDMIEQTEKKTVTVQADDHEVTDDATDDDGEEQNNDYMPEEPAEEAEETDEPTIDDIADALEQAVAEKNARTVQAPKPYPPFYTQYLELSEHTDGIVLIRLGDFYEAFDGDAETLADELNMTLASRKLTDDERVPMIGFPYHAADTYIAKIRKNHDVVIVEINGDIVPLKKISAPVCKDDLPDKDEDIEELSEAEMRQFDGDIQEPKTADEQDDETTPYSLSSFDKETMIYLYDLLDGKFDMA